MNTSTVIRQLHAILPMYTELFTDNIDIIRVSVASGVATVETAGPHRLGAPGATAYPTIVGIKSKTVISSLSREGLIVNGVTATRNDLTVGYNYVEIVGATPSEFNGQYKPITATGGTTFSYKLEEEPLGEIATGSIFLIEDRHVERGLNGRKCVTIVNDTTFTYDVDSTLPELTTNVGSCRAHPRISGAANIATLENSYTKQSELDYWAYVVLGSMTISKNRFTERDSITVQGPANDFRQTAIIDFDVFVVGPASGELSGRKIRDSMQSDVAPALYKSLLNWLPPSEFSENQYSRVVATGHDVSAFNGSVLIHRFSFERSVDILKSDTIAPAFNTAFRSIDLNILNPDERRDTLLMSAKIELDQTP